MAEPKHSIELIDYIDVVLKHKWFILLATLACTAGALWQTQNTITQYQASALLFAKGPQEQVAEVGSSTLGIEFFNLVAESDEIRLALDVLRDKLLPDVKNVESANYTLTTSTRENTITLTVTSELRALVIPILSTWADTLIASTRDISENESIEFYEFVTGQLNSAINKLEQYDSELEILERDQPIEFLTKEKEGHNLQIADLQKEIFEISENLRKEELGLVHAQEAVNNFEIENIALHLLSAEELQEQLSNNKLSAGAKKSLTNLLQLNTLNKMRLDVVRDSSITLQQFDKETKYHLLLSKSKKLQEVIKELAEDIINARGDDIKSRYETESLQRELDLRRGQIQSNSSGESNSINEKFSVSVGKGGPVIDKSFDGPNPEHAGPPKRQYTEQDDEKWKIEALTIDDISDPSNAMISILLSEARIKVHNATITLTKGEKDLNELSLMQLDLERNLANTKRKRDGLKKDFESREKSLANQIDVLTEINDHYISTYGHKKKSIGRLTQNVSTIKTELAALETQLVAAQKKASNVFEKANRAIARRQRLLRSKETVSATFNRFSDLLEEARIAREKSTSGLRLLTQDKQLQTIQPPAATRRVIISGGFGFAISLFLSFLLEYIHRARRNQEQNL